MNEISVLIKVGDGVVRVTFVSAEAPSSTTFDLTPDEWEILSDILATFMENRASE